MIDKVAIKVIHHGGAKVVEGIKDFVLTEVSCQELEVLARFELVKQRVDDVNAAAGHEVLSAFCPGMLVNSAYLVAPTS